MSNILRKWFFRTGRCRNLYRLLFHPSAREWAAYVERHFGMASIGIDCEINNDASITDPYLVRLGNGVTLSSCALISHDGSINQIRRATGIRLDAVGPIDIRDNCFIGYGAVVLRGVTIGPDAIVAAGAVVVADVPPRTVVGGVPARPLCTIDELAERLSEECRELPWMELIRQRDGAFDPKLEPQLVAMRKNWFWKGL